MASDALCQLSRCLRWVQESMRLRPVAAGGMLRVVARDVRLSNGLVLPRGCTITGSNLAVLNSPHSWDEPERFIPVRPRVMCSLHLPNSLGIWICCRDGRVGLGTAVRTLAMSLLQRVQLVLSFVQCAPAA